jgi:hypothetical protein
MLFELHSLHFDYAAMLSKFVSGDSVHVAVMRHAHYMECNTSVTGLSYCTNISAFIYLPRYLSLELYYQSSNHKLSRNPFIKAACCVFNSGRATRKWVFSIRDLNCK